MGRVYLKEFCSQNGAFLLASFSTGLTRIPANTHTHTHIKHSGKMPRLPTAECFKVRNFLSMANLGFSLKPINRRRLCNMGNIKFNHSKETMHCIKLVLKSRSQDLPQSSVSISHAAPLTICRARLIYSERQEPGPIAEGKGSLLQTTSIPLLLQGEPFRRNRRQGSSLWIPP